MGDLNARTAVAPNYIMDDFIAPENDNELYIHVCDKVLKRYSEEKAKNSFGTMILDMCKSLKLRIVNGDSTQTRRLVNPHVKRSWEAA